MPAETSTISASPIQTWQGDSRLASGRSNKASGTPVLATSEQGMPKPVVSLGANTSLQTIGGAKYAQVNVTHKISSQDQAFHHANVWVTGLAGNPNPQLQSSSTSSPHTLLLPATGNNVTLTVQSVGKDGSLLPLSSCPSTAVQL